MCSLVIKSHKKYCLTVILNPFYNYLNIIINYS